MAPPPGPYRVIWKGNGNPGQDPPLFSRLPNEDGPAEAGGLPNEMLEVRQRIVATHEEAEVLMHRLRTTGVAEADSVEEEGPLFGQPAGALAPQARFRHLEPAPHGVDFDFARRFRGARGDGVTIVDVELGWNLASPFLPTVTRWTVIGNGVDGAHGRAVIALLGARRSGTFEGLVSGASLAIAQANPGDPARNIFNVIRSVAQREPKPTVLLLERQMSRQEIGRCCLPVESWRAGRLALQFAARRGIHVVQAAGNGGHNLPRTSATDTIVVGARQPNGLPAAASNRGQRIDLWGPATKVATFGIPAVGIPGQPPPLVGLGGTSSAAAVVAAAVAVICGILKHNGHQDLTPGEMRQLLVKTGSTPNGAPGPQPDLRLALETLAKDKVFEEATPTI